MDGPVNKSLHNQKKLGNKNKGIKFHFKKNISMVSFFHDSYALPFNVFLKSRS